MKFSFIIPVYNRPEELAEFLDSCLSLNFEPFEIIVIEDGSQIKSEQICVSYNGLLTIRYFEKKNEGPSIARNYGAAHAQGEYLIFTDSDCILPQEYLSTITTSLLDNTDVFGGPDKAHPSFNALQKAISYAMTSVLTTGGIRGQKKSVEKFYPRSFNMGIKKNVFDELGGFPHTKMHPGEDMLLAIEIHRRNYRLQYIHEAVVYHKRRTSLSKFFKQIAGFGKVRIYISQLYPETFKWIYLLPIGFVLFSLSSLILGLWMSPICILPMLLYFFIVFLHASWSNRSIKVGVLSMICVGVQFTAYAKGLLGAVSKIYCFKNPEFDLRAEKLFLD